MRFTEAQNVRLHEAVEREGKESIQSFIHTAAMLAVNESERVHHERKVRREEKRRPPDDPIHPRGYGLRQRLTEETPPLAFSPREPQVDPTPAPPPPPQVVIAQAQATVPEVDRLAAFVARGAWPSTRDDRMRVAAQVISTSSRDDAEKRQTARTLDERIASLEGKPASSSPTSPLDLIANWFFK